MINGNAETAGSTVSSPELTEVIFPQNKSNTVSRDFRWIFFDLFFLMRPSQYLPIWATLFAGFVATSLKTNPFVFNSIDLTSSFWMILLSVSLGSGAVFVYNQIADKESDRLNGKLLILPRNLVSDFEAKWFGHLIITVALVIGFIASSSVFAVYVLCGLLGYLYNSHPFRWKNNPYLSMLVNFLGGGFCFVVGGLTVQSFSVDLLVAGIPYALSWGAVFSLVTIPDIYGDHKSGKRTISVSAGVEKTKWIAAVMVFVSVIASWFLNDMIFFIAAGLSFPFYLLTLFKNSAGIFTPVKLSFVFLMLVPIYFSPIFIIPVFLNILICRIYYKYRFGIDYPNFSSNK